MDSNLLDSCKEARGELEAYKIEPTNEQSGEKVCICTVQVLSSK